MVAAGRGGGGVKYVIPRDGCRLCSSEIAQISEDYAGRKLERKPHVRRISCYDLPALVVLYSEGRTQLPEVWVHDDM